MTTRITGYLDGVAYTVEMDADGVPDDESGCITHASPPLALAAVIARDGLVLDVMTPGPSVTVTIDEPIGVLAALIDAGEVVAVSGDPIPGYDDASVRDDAEH